MGPVIDDHDVTVWQGDARTVLGELPAGSVQCIVTSPPYYGLRDYGTGTWDGGDPHCDHRSPTMREGRNENRPTLGGGIMATNSGQLLHAARQACCGKCGASRVDQQIGLETSPADYVEQLRAVFAEARRVLAPDGVMWLNLGDSYASQGGMNGVGPNAIVGSTLRQAETRTRPASGIPAKNLLGMPWRVAFALQDDGWILRNDIIWSKPNAMPESVTDRLSTRHEHVFLFTRSRRYIFNLDAIREDYSPHTESFNRMKARFTEQRTADVLAARTGSVLGRATEPNGGLYVGGGASANPLGRNPGDVWSIPTSPTPYAHFATMPPELVRRCILAGCPESGTVLDPFAGSGTTLMVARQLGRRAVGIELNPGYVDIIRRRIGQEPLNFDEAAG